MNRIVLVGNGFDLAHGLKTSYSDFINDFWKNKAKHIIENHKERRYEDEDIVIDPVPHKLMYDKNRNYNEFNQNLFETNGSKVNFKNKFLEVITKHHDINKWVDIENMYYLILKNSFLGDKKNSLYKNKTKRLNQDFLRIQNLLVEYLKKEVYVYPSKIPEETLSRIKSKIGSIIFSRYHLKDLSEITAQKIIEEKYKETEEFIKTNVFTPEQINDFNIKDAATYNHFKYEINREKFFKFIINESNSRIFNFFPDQTLILNFNYTPITDYYKEPYKFNYPNEVQGDARNTEVINIHGSIDFSYNNPIIFGYGDELDDDYKEIEKLDNNEYLENIKSIKYLETDNYKRLLEFINSDLYQVIIMGHSCGNSDRTMLNTIFEHENCASIKFYYHKINQKADNYRDIVMNISRNFNDKAIMRDRVVNKKYCEPLL